MALHEQSVGASDEWYTPSYIFEALGCKFDLDVASPGEKVTHWIPTKSALIERGLQTPWHGFVWMNPPFGARNGIVPWLDKFQQHNNGIALTPDRTSAPWWQNFARQMDLILFVSPKIRFIDQQGDAGNSPAQGTTLFALGTAAKTALRRAEKHGIGFCLRPDK